jgi:anti-sigma B factor antagonist
VQSKDGPHLRERFDITEEHPADGVAVFVPRGQLDLFTAGELRARLLDVVDHGAQTVVIDLCATEYVDSSALAALVKVRTRLAGRGGQLIVTGCSDDLRNRFRVTGLESLFVMADSRDEALGLARRDP